MIVYINSVGTTTSSANEMYDALNRHRVPHVILNLSKVKQDDMPIIAKITDMQKKERKHISLLTTMHIDCPSLSMTVESLHQRTIGKMTLITTCQK